MPKKRGPWGRMLGATAGKCTGCPGRKECKGARQVARQGQRSGTPGMRGGGTRPGPGRRGEDR